MTVEASPAEVQPEAIAIAVVHEDRDVLVVDKTGGLVVHPGAGNPCHTLQNALSGGIRVSRGCRAPASFIGSTRTPADFWSWRARSRRTRP